MSHVGDDLIRRFAEGTLEESVAVSVALHLDGCARCASRAAVSDPLASAWAAADDPAVPPDLAIQIKAALSADDVVAPGRRSAPELFVASALMAAAALLLVALGDPLGLVTEAASASLAVATGTAVLHEQLQLVPSAWVLGAATLLGLGGVLLLRRVRVFWGRTS